MPPTEHTNPFLARMTLACGVFCSGTLNILDTARLFTIRLVQPRSNERSRTAPISSEPAGAAPKENNVAYLISQYPKISHTFIRREMLALERRGFTIHRFAVRGWDAALVDIDDTAEIGRTTYILQQGLLSLSLASFRFLFISPRRFFYTLALSLRMMRGSDRSALFHVVYFAEACWLARQLIARKIRHLHAHFGTNPAEVAMLASQLAGTPFSFTVHGPEEFDRASGIRLAEKVRRAEFVISVSSFGRSQLFRLVEHRIWSRVRVVHCGIDQSFVSTRVVQPCVAPRLVCVGRLCEQKGQMLLVTAAARLAAEGMQFKLVFVGDGELRNDIDHLIDQLKLNEVVTLVGWASGQAVRDEILQARALILPSFAEGLPVVLMEAMALGRPVLTTYVAGIPELVVPGETGWLVPAGSEEALVNAMRLCLNANAVELTRMGELARSRVLLRHNVDSEAERLGSLFQASLKGKHRVP